MAVGVGVVPREPFMVGLRYLDVVVVAIAAGPALALGVPALGYALGAAAWILQRIIAATDQRWIRKVPEPRKQLGLSLFEAFGRIWLLAGAIVGAGLVARANGLTAAVVILGAYSLALMVRLISGPPRGTRGR